MKKQTAVEWLIDELGEYFPNEIGGIHLMVNKAKELEKQQIIDSYEHADMVGRASLIREIAPDDIVVMQYPELSAEEYYTETFKSE